MGGRGLFLLFF